MRTDGRRHAIALAGLALGLTTAPGLPAEPLPRLAATLVTPGHVAALVESAVGQSWVAPGEVVGDCRLLRVDTAGASLQCGAQERQLRLAAGDARLADPGTVADPFRPVMDSVQISPAGLRSILENPQASALGVDLVPVSRAGQLIGWAVARLDPDSPIAATGLRQDDLVVAVDGAPAGQPGAFMAALRALPGADTFLLELLREGRPTAVLVAVSAAPVSP